MKAELFYGAADGPELLVDQADDGTPLVDHIGWTCRGCDTLYASQDAAERCCVGPNSVADGR